MSRGNNTNRFFDQDFRFWRDPHVVRAIQWTTIVTVFLVAIVVSLTLWFPVEPDYATVVHEGHSYLVYQDKAITHHPDCACKEVARE